MSDPCLRRYVRRAGVLLLVLVREIVRGVFVGACVEVQLLSDRTARGAFFVGLSVHSAVLRSPRSSARSARVFYTASRGER